MATSGTETFTVTRDEIFTDALQICGVLNGSEAIGANDITTCSRTLNMLLKNLPIDTWLLWCYINIEVPLVVATSSYTIGPTGTVVANRPLRIAKAWLRNTNNSPSTDVPITQLARQDYQMLTPKESPGIPVNYYYDPQLTNGVLTTWPVLNTSGYSVFISVQRTIQDISASVGTQNFDLPQEWFLPLSWMLADQISMKYCNNLQKIGMIREEAKTWREKMANYSREEEGVYFTPNFQGGGYNGVGL